MPLERTHSAQIHAVFLCIYKLVFAMLVIANPKEHTMQIIKVVANAPIAAQIQRDNGHIRLGQLNAHNLFDTVDDPSIQDTVVTRAESKVHLGKLALTIRDAMGAPDIITMQEVENVAILKKLADRPELKGLGYKPLVIEGSDPRGIDNAILYRDTVQLKEVQQFDPVAITAKGDKSHFFTRPPIIARFAINGREDAKRGVSELTVVAAHLTSKLGQEKAAAKRLEQAQQLADVSTWLTAVDPKAAVVISGDLNMERSEPEFAPLRKETGASALSSLAQSVPSRDRFTWRDGRKHLMLDHILATPNLAKNIVEVSIPHIATEADKVTAADPLRPEGSSDHDPVVATIKL